MTRYADDLDTHPTQETRPLCPVDQRLRSADYAIHSRPVGGPVLWRHRPSGAILTQAEALGRLKAARKLVRAAKEGPGE